MRSALLLTALIPIGWANKVQFAQEVEVLGPSSRSPGSLKSSSSGKSIRSTHSTRNNEFIDKSDIEDMGLKSTVGSSRSTKDLIPLDGEPKPRRRTHPTGSSASAVDEIKNRVATQDPILFIIIRIIERIYKALQGGIKNEFVSEDELEVFSSRYDRRLVGRDPVDLALRIARPTAFLVSNIWAFFDFPFGAPYWGLALLANIVVFTLWKGYDSKGMLAEVSHWDYAFAACIFVALGLGSLASQAMAVLKQIFFAMIPFLAVAFFVGVSSYAAFKKPYQYYSH